MRSTIASILLAAVYLGVCAQPDLDYYLPAGTAYDPSVPVPAQVTGHQVGEWHLTHDKLVYCLRALAEQSDRVIYEEYARSWENRPLFHLIITSPANHRRLEEIRTSHVALCDPDEPVPGNMDDMPVVVRLGYNIHGNESSAGNASVLVAYYLAAAQGKEINDWLDKMVILLDPCLNPDGFNRHASWVNMHRSQVPMADPDSRGFNEVWPGGRTNHYWFDLNRDWILVQHPETRGRVDVFHDWKPNVQTDHHEMEAGSTFFFQPGVPSRTNPRTPEGATVLTQKISEYHARALDEIGSLYFTEERFDDYYYGKGSSYPDVNGGIGILFEQAGTRGDVRATDRGELSFPFAIRNQVMVSFSTLRASLALRNELLEYQAGFYRSALAEASAQAVKAWVFGDAEDATKLNRLLDIVLKHRIQVFELSGPVTLDNQTYEPGSAYIIPLQQAQYRMIQSLFEPVTTFRDSLFYDISTWTLPYAFDIPFSPVTAEKQAGDLTGMRVSRIKDPAGEVTGGPSDIGYLFEWTDYLAPRALYMIQDAGLMANVCTEPFTADVNGSAHRFSCGSIFVPVQKQPVSGEETFELMKKAAGETGIRIYALASSFTGQGPDLGSNSIVPVRKPEILLMAGDGVRSTDAGEVWHLLDTRYRMPVRLIEPGRFNGMDPGSCNTIILPAGSYNDIDDEGVRKLKDWISRGGTVVALNSANRWLKQNKLIDIDFTRPTPDTNMSRQYGNLSLDRGAQYISGSIFEAALDITHPVGYGHTRTTIPVFRNSTLFAAPVNRPYAVPLRYTADPLLSGYVSDRNYELIRNSPAVIVSSLGSGRIISFMDNPNFRAFWYGTNKLFINAVYFGHIISAASTR
jgi:hypothetical protein